MATKAKPGLRRRFYDDLLAVVNGLPARAEVYVCGDFNAKVGHGSEPAYAHVRGRFGKGRMNDNGEALLNFATSTGLFLTNTAFRHGPGANTTWRSFGRIHSRTKSFFVHNQIDFVLCRQSHKPMLRDARSYQHYFLPESDHRLTVAYFSKHSAMWQLRNGRTETGRGAPAPDPSALKRAATREVYRRAVAEGIRRLADDLIAGEVRGDRVVPCEWEGVKAVLLDSLRLSCPDKCRAESRVKGWVADAEVQRMRTQRQRLTSAYRTSRQPAAKRALQRQRKLLLKEMLQRIRLVQRRNFDSFCAEIEATRSDARRAHLAAKRLKMAGAPKGVFVSDERGRQLLQPKARLGVVERFFADKFGRSVPPTVEFNARHAGALSKPIEAHEVWAVCHGFSNNKAVGVDGVAGELFKYAICDPPADDPDRARIAQWAADDPFCVAIAALFNWAAATGAAPSDISDGWLALLQKPKKPRGPPGSLRPITILTALRKTLSCIALRRAVDCGIADFLPQSQHAFLRGRSTADAVFAHRIYSNLAERSPSFSYWVLSVDLSSAFDTPRRNELYQAVSAATGADPDVLAFTRMLLSNSRLSVHLDKEESEFFATTIGTPQGDSYSPMLFIVFFEYVMRMIRPFFGAPAAGDAALPAEIQYADDLDFLSTSRVHLEHIYSVLRALLPTARLDVNPSKSTLIEIKPSDTIGDEPEWKRTEILGNKLGGRADLKYHIAKAREASRKLYRLFINKHCSLELKYRMFQAHIEPIVMYNIGCAGLTAGDWRRLDSCQYMFLRTLLGIRWPNTLSYRTLYQRITAPRWTTTACRRRWNLLGHQLRKPASAPAHKALWFAVSQGWQRSRGRRQAGLWTQLQSDYELTFGRPFDGAALHGLLHHARDRPSWFNIAETVVSHVCHLDPHAFTNKVHVQ